jgi:ClpP class serine protease
MRHALNILDLRRALGDCEREMMSLGGKRGARIGTLLHQLAFGKSVSDDEVCGTLAGGRHGERMARDVALLPSKGGRSTAIVTAHGMATYKAEMQPFVFSTALLAHNINLLANDAAIDSIVIDFDTPGGQVVGIQENASAIFAARQRKPVIAYVDSLAASAGYWLASQATTIVSIPSGEVAAIGCFVLHLDVSGALEQAGVKPTFVVSKSSPHKVDGNPYQPLSVDARAHEQEQVDRIAQQFIGAVSRGRGVGTATVAADFGQGRTLNSAQARIVFAIDLVGGLDQALRLAASPAVGRAARLAAMRTNGASEHAARNRQRRLKMLSS